MSLNPQALTTVARYKTFAGITSVASDTKIEMLVNIVTDYIERYCDRRFLQTTYTDEYYDGDGSMQLLLKNYPVVEAYGLTINERGTDFNEASFNAVDARNLHVDWNAGLVELVGNRFGFAPRQYKITYKAGYAFKNDAATFVTLESLGIGDLEYACWQMVSNMFQRAGSQSGITSESIGNYSVSYGAGSGTVISPEVKMVLEKYRRPHLM